MMINKPITQQTSPIDISPTSEISPISQTEIIPVNADEWKHLTLTELNEQLYALQMRYYAALEVDKYDIAQVIQQGIIRLQRGIKYRSDQQNNKSGI
jgi:hypothetical protein